MTPRKCIIDHFKKVDRKIYSILKDFDFELWIEVVPKKDYFQKLCREIIYQQLAGKAAEAIYQRFITLLPKGQVTPTHILALSDQSLRDQGLSWAKVKYVKDLALQTQSGTVQLNQLDILDDIAVINELTKVKGIGRWTAEMFLMFSLGRENIFSFGDLGLRKGLEKVYQLAKPGDAQIHQIIKPWSPYKTYGSIALWQCLDIK